MTRYVLDLSLSVRDVLLAIPAWAGAAVAVLGLGAWRRQLHGREEYDLARRLLRATYRYRDALTRARSPFSFAPLHPQGQSARERAEADWHARTEPLDAARRELEAELLESEVLWGPGHRTHYERLDEIYTQLYAALLEHLDSLDPAPEPDLQQRDRVVARRAIMYARSDRSDPFSQSTTAAVKVVERVLRPHLRR